MVAKITFDGKQLAGVLAPGQQKIAFVSRQDGDLDIYVADRDGKKPC